MSKPLPFASVDEYDESFWDNNYSVDDDRIRATIEALVFATKELDKASAYRDAALRELEALMPLRAEVERLKADNAALVSLLRELDPSGSDAACDREHPGDTLIAEVERLRGLLKTACVAAGRCPSFGGVRV